MPLPQALPQPQKTSPERLLSVAGGGPGTSGPTMKKTDLQGAHDPQHEQNHSRCSAWQGGE